MVLFIPKTRLHVRQFPTWFTPQLRHSHKCLRTLQRKINKNPSTSNHQRLSKASNLSMLPTLLLNLHTYEQSLIHNIATSKDPKKFILSKSSLRHMFYLLNFPLILLLLKLMLIRQNCLINILFCLYSQ